MKWHKNQVSDKWQNSYKINKKIHFWGNPFLLLVDLFWKFIYRPTIVYNDIPLDTSLEDLKLLCREKPSSQVYRPTPKLMIKPDLF